jgi:hypothetical protein
MSSNTDNIDVTVANDSPVEQHTESGEPGEDLLPGHAESENDSTVGHDADSAVGEDNADSTASITSSILRYRTIRGRTFHSERGDAFYWYVPSANIQSLSILKVIKRPTGDLMTMLKVRLWTWCKMPFPP